MRIFAEQVEERVFLKLHSRDMVALLLDPSIDASMVLGGNDKYLDARAEFVREWVRVETELGLNSDVSSTATSILQQV
jgi:hypothetical protein